MYDSEPAVLESLQQINDWVNNATNGRMTDFLSALPPNMLLLLINAVHFKGKTFLNFVKDPSGIIGLIYHCLHCRSLYCIVHLNYAVP